MGYRVRTRTKEITANTTINDMDFAGWMCVNTGSATVEVNKIPLAPTEGLDFTACIPPDSVWEEPIKIVVTPGGKLTLMQLLFREDKLGAKRK